jgi:hypothetical protein
VPGEAPCPSWSGVAARSGRHPKPALAPAVAAADMMGGHPRRLLSSTRRALRLAMAAGVAVTGRSDPSGRLSRRWVV